jgi:hypothetical protein
MNNVKGVSDPHLIRREVYNTGENEITFEIIGEKIPYIKLSGITPGAVRIVVKPRAWAILNHAFYTPHTSDGRNATVVENYGDMIGKRNTLPSNPMGEGAFV